MSSKVLSPGLAFPISFIALIELLSTSAKISAEIFSLFIESDISSKKTPYKGPIEPPISSIRVSLNTFNPSEKE